jgi:RimJ/RimL family protein N-acetyltransferase
MVLHTANTSVPETRRSERLLLRPLRTTDVELDYAAVMASAERLRLWSDSDWPADDFTLEGNLADLQMHQDDFAAGKGYTYTVLSPDGSRCLGCVYLYDAQEPMLGACLEPQAPVSVRFWVRTEEIANDLDRHLLAVLRQWLAEEWAFDCLIYGVNPLDTRQAAILQDEGLALKVAYTRTNGRPWHVYG